MSEYKQTRSYDSKSKAKAVTEILTSLEIPFKVDYDLKKETDGFEKVRIHFDNTPHDRIDVKRKEK